MSKPGSRFYPEAIIRGTQDSCVHRKICTQDSGHIPRHTNGNECAPWGGTSQILLEGSTDRTTMLSHFSSVRLCVTPQMAARQAPPSMGFSRQEHWSGVPLPSQRTTIARCYFHETRKIFSIFPSCDPFTWSLIFFFKINWRIMYKISFPYSLSF